MSKLATYTLIWMSVKLQQGYGSIIASGKVSDEARAFIEEHISGARLWKHFGWDWQEDLYEFPCTVLLMTSEATSATGENGKRRFKPVDRMLTSPLMASRGS